MKVAVLLYQNMRHAPFLKFYERIFQEMEGVDYDVIYLNRHPELNEPNDEYHIPISWVGRNDHNVLSKIATSVCYPVRVRRILKKGGFDFVFVLTTMPGVLLSGYLRKHYMGRFIFDIRDYTREYIKVYYQAEAALTQSSAMNVISSPDFIRFLPEAEYHVCHNFNIPKKTEEIVKKTEYGRIIIAYIGNIQYADYCMKLIKLVEADDRFEFHLWGPEGGKMEITHYVKKIDCPRISMKGKFKPEDKAHIFGESDIVFNCYGNDNNIVKYAISNKFYDAAVYRRPLLVSPETTMQRLTGGFAFSIDLDKCDNLNELYDWYYGMDSIKFEEYCDSVVSEAVAANEKLKNKIQEALKQS